MHISYTIHEHPKGELLITRDGDEAKALIGAFRQGWPELVNMDGEIPMGFIPEAGITVHSIEYH